MSLHFFIFAFRKMKKHIRNKIALILSVIILVSSNGVVLSAHSCFSSHVTKISLFGHKGCCSGEKKKCDTNPSSENTFHKSCCSFAVTYHRVDVSSPVVKIGNFSCPSLFPEHIISFSRISFLRSFVLKNTQTPPLIAAGTDRLHAISLLKI